MKSYAGFAAALLLFPMAFGATGQPSLDAGLRELATANPSVVEVTDIGRSRHGRPIRVVRLASPEVGGEGDRHGVPGRPEVAISPDHRPAILIVAGLDGRHRLGPRAAVEVAQRLITDHGDLLDTATVYIVPNLNPDNAAFHAGPGPRTDYGRTFWAHDADHDGRVNEDGAEDLDGDGVITMMRIADPPPGSPLTATLMIDPDHPRLLREPDRAKGERATHAVLIEGIDNDGDGAFNEDGVGGAGGGGVSLDMNFPALWPEFKDGAGPHQLAEPESLALARWMLDRPNLALVLVYGPHDSLVNIPQAGKMDESGRVPLGIENDDKPYYEQISKAFKEITGMTDAPKGSGGGLDGAGSLRAWAYAHLGLPAFGTPIWVRPDLVKKAELEAEDAREVPKNEADEPGDEKEGHGGAVERPEMPSEEEIKARVAAFMGASDEERVKLMAEYRRLPPELQQRVMAIAQGQPDPGAGGGAPVEGSDAEKPEADAKPPSDKADAAKRGDKGKKDESDDAKWLRYSDDRRGGQGFVEWKPFDHPQLGPVEIGGFVPGFKLDPPEDEIPRLVEEQTKFVAELLGRLPRIETPEPLVERLGPGVWRITLRASNTAYFPTMSAIGVKARRADPTLASIDLPLESLVAGEKLQRTWTVPGSGGTTDARWTILAPDGSTVRVGLRSPLLGERRIDVTLQEARP